MTDAVDHAIAATGAAGPQMGRIEIPLAGGRIARLMLPVPLLAQDVGAITGILADISHQTQTVADPAQAARSRLWLPGT